MDQDVHFYIDNAPPEEVMYVLRCLTNAGYLSSREIGTKLHAHYGFEMQSDRNYSPRRLFDLGLADRTRSGSSLFYKLSARGGRVQEVASTDRSLGYELLHILHYYGYQGRGEDRKLFWSYRKLCELVWSEQRLRSSGELAASIQSLIETEFSPPSQVSNTGFNFSKAGANQGLAWLRALEPSPISEDTLVARGALNPVLALLVLDHYYRENSIEIGSPVLLSDEALAALSGALFVTPQAFRDMLLAASRLSERVRPTDTLGGTSIRLNAPFTLTDL